MKMLTRIEIEYILQNSDKDIKSLILGARKESSLDIKKLATIIDARQKLKDKVPSWYAIPGLIYPNNLSTEQSSSEATALYKQQFIENGSKIADLTGGLGIDSSFFANKAASVDIFERNTQLTDSYHNNFPLLGLDNIKIHNIEITQELAANLHSEYDLIYLDPARRDGLGKKVFLLNDCEPNILGIKELLFQKTEKILLKLSPMMDISKLLQQLEDIYRIDIVAVNNECKEILAHLKKGGLKDQEELRFHTINILSKKDNHNQIFDFAMEDEKSCVPTFFNYKGYSSPADALYLYEPNKAILKAGAFKSLAVRHKLSKLAPHTHLYISNKLEDKFPGKIFKVISINKLNKQTIKEIQSSYPAASITARNLPIDSSNLRKKLNLKESDKYHIFGCKSTDSESILFITEHFYNSLNKPETQL